MKFLQRIRKIMKNLSNSTFYKVMFQCDKSLIPDNNDRSLIERCSKNTYEYKYNITVRKAKSDQSLLMRSSNNNHENE